MSIIKRFFQGGKDSRLFGKLKSPRREGLHMEPLEDRLLLTAMPNDWNCLQEVQGAIPEGAEFSEMSLVVDKQEGDVYVGIVVSNTEEGTFDPGRMAVIDPVTGAASTDAVIVQQFLNYDYNGTQPKSRDSLLILKLTPGTPEIVEGEDPGVQTSQYTLRLYGEGNNTVGNFSCRVFLPGDTDSNPTDADPEIGITEANEVTRVKSHIEYTNAYDNGAATPFMINYYRETYGVDITKWESVYDVQYDVNMDGKMSADDLTITRANVGLNLTNFRLIVDEIAPESTVTFDGQELPDTLAGVTESVWIELWGQNDEGKIANTLEITVTDESGIEKVEVTLFDRGVDGSGEAISVALPPENILWVKSADNKTWVGTVTFDGVALTNRDIYELCVTATDTYDNFSDPAESSFFVAKRDEVPEKEPVVITPQQDGELESVLSKLDISEKVNDGASKDQTLNFSDIDDDDWNDQGDGTSITVKELNSGTKLQLTKKNDGNGFSKVEYLGNENLILGDGDKVEVSIGVTPDEGDAFYVGFMIFGEDDPPEGAQDFTGAIDLRDDSIKLGTEGTETLDLTDGVTDPNGATDFGAVLVKITATDGFAPTAADLGAKVTDGVLSFDLDMVRNYFISLAAGATATVTIEYAVFDTAHESNLSDPATVMVTVTGVNDAPTAENFGVSVDAQESAALDWASYVDDVDGDLLKLANLYGTAVTGEVQTINIASGVFNKGTADEEEISGLAPGALGYLSIATDGAVTYVATGDYLKWRLAEGDTFSFDVPYTVSDTSSATASGTCSVVVNGVFDALTLKTAIPDQAVNIRAAADADGWVDLANRITFSSDRDQSYTFAVVSITGAAGAVSSELVNFYDVVAGQNGSVSLRVKQSVLAELAAGDYTVTFGWTNGAGDVVTDQMFKLVVSEIEYTVSPITGGSTTEDGTGAVTKTLAPETIIVDGETATSYVVVAGNIGLQSVKGHDGAADITPASELWASILALGSVGEGGVFTFANNTELFQYLAAGESLTIEYTYLLNDVVTSDGSFNGLTGTVTVEVTGVNDAPKAEDFTAAVASQGSVALDWADHVSDVDGDALALANLYGTAVTGEAQTINIISGTFKGKSGEEAVSGLAAGSLGYLSIAADGTVTYVATGDYLKWRLAAGDVFTFDVPYIVTDAALSSNMGTCTVTVSGAFDVLVLKTAPDQAVNISAKADDAGWIHLANLVTFSADKDQIYTFAVSEIRGADGTVSTDLIDFYDFVGGQDGTVSLRVKQSILAELAAGDYTVTFGWTNGAGDVVTDQTFKLVVSEIEYTVSPIAGGTTTEDGTDAFTKTLAPETIIVDGETATSYVVAAGNVGLQSVKGHDGAADITPASELWSSILALGSVGEGGVFTFANNASLFQYLADGQSLTIEYTYLLNDVVTTDGTFNGLTGTVTVTVTGLNDAPTANGYDGAAVKSTVGFIDFPLQAGAAGYAVDVDGNLDVTRIQVKNSAGEFVELKYGDAAMAVYGEAGKVEIVKDGENYFLRYTLTEDEIYTPIGTNFDVAIDYKALDALGLVSENSALFTANVEGNYEAPARKTDADGNFIDIGSIQGTAAYGEGVDHTVTVKLSEFFTGQIDNVQVTLTDATGILDKSVHANGYTISEDKTTVTFYFINGGEWTLDENDNKVYSVESTYHPTLDLSAFKASITVSDNRGNSATSDTFSVSLKEQVTTTIALVGVATPSATQTATVNRGKWHYASEIPETDYTALVDESGANLTEYYLEIWLQDTVSVITGDASTGLVNLNFMLVYEHGDDSSITSVTSYVEEDDNVNYFCGNYSLSNEAYYDAAETKLSAIAISWLPDVTYGSNAERALLLARLKVTLSADGDAKIGIGSATVDSAGLPDDSSRPTGFDPRWAYARVGYQVSDGELDESQIDHSTSIRQAGTAIVGTSSAEFVVDGGVYVRTVADKTETDEFGRVDKLSVNTNCVNEWQTHYAEIWVKASEAEKYSGVSTDFGFNAEYFTVVDIEFGSAFDGTVGAIDSVNGTIQGIRGTAKTDLSGDSYVLLARVKFESGEGQGVAWSDCDMPITLDNSVFNAKVQTAAGTEFDAYQGRSSSTELWGNPYDVNDDGQITGSDFTSFALVYGSESTTGELAKLLLDFDRNGWISGADFSSFALYYGLTKADVVSGAKSLDFPAAFTQRYVGSTLSADNTALVGKVLDAANQAWADALELTETVSVTLVVKDFGTDELAKAQIVDLDDATGAPSRGIIYLDNDAAGNLWYAQLAAPGETDRYDLYTVLLHELGHLYGYENGYAAFNAVYERFSEILNADGHSTQESDVMYESVNPGERKELTENDITVADAILTAAKEDSALRTFVIGGTSAIVATNVSANLAQESATGLTLDFAGLSAPLASNLPGSVSVSTRLSDSNLDASALLIDSASRRQLLAMGLEIEGAADAPSAEAQLVRDVIIDDIFVTGEVESDGLDFVEETLVDESQERTESIDSVFDESEQI